MDRKLFEVIISKIERGSKRIIVDGSRSITHEQGKLLSQKRVEFMLYEERKGKKMKKCYVIGKSWQGVRQAPCKKEWKAMIRAENSKISSSTEGTIAA